MSQDKNPTGPASHIAIVGGGLCGLNVLLEQINTYRAAYENAPHDTPPLTLHWIEKSGNFGAGIAYDVDDAVFLLNQPASLMSPFEDDPDHFVRWLQDHAPEIDKDGFATRKLYGVYLSDIRDQALQSLADNNIPLSIQFTTAEVTGFTATKDTFTLNLNSDQENLTVGTLVLATGHLANHDLKKQLNHIHYQQTPFQKAKIQREVQNSDGPAGIIGTGQSMMDCLAALEASGFEDKIYLFSRDNVEPWPFDPKHYGDHITPYQIQYLNPEQISVDTTYTELLEKFDAEVKHAEENLYGLGHVLISLDKDGLAKKAQGHPRQEDIEKFIKRVDKFYANPTTPQRYQLFRRLKDKGQVELVKTAVDISNITPDAAGHLIISNKNDGQDYTLSHLFNSAGFRRSAFNQDGQAVDPLARCADKFNLLARHPHDPASIKPGAQKQDNLFIVGPQSNAGRWGVETFRPHNKAAGVGSVLYSLNATKNHNTQTQLQTEKEKTNVKNRNISKRTHSI